jgi:hypothetical protein
VAHAGAGAAAVQGVRGHARGDSRGGPAATGLSSFGRPKRYMERQLARWQRQWELSVAGRCPGTPNSPSGSRPACRAGRYVRPRTGTLVHGDYRLDNVLVAPDGGGSPGPDRGRAGLGDVHPGRPAGRPRAVARVYWMEPGDVDSLDVQWRRRSPPARESSPAPRSPAAALRRPGGT